MSTYFAPPTKPMATKIDCDKQVLRYDILIIPTTFFYYVESMDGYLYGTLVDHTYPKFGFENVIIFRNRAHTKL